MGLVNGTKRDTMPLPPMTAFAELLSVQLLVAPPLTSFVPAAREMGAHWARVLPTVVLVPAFGLRALPTPVRISLGLLFALCMYSAQSAPLSSLTDSVPWPILFLSEMVSGLPIAIAAAVPLWAAASAGGLAEQLRGGSESMTSPLVEGKTSPLGVLFAMLASIAFLASGGPARVVSRLAQPSTLGDQWLLRVSTNLLAGIDISVAFAAPLLGAAVVLDVVSALGARAAAPAHLQQSLAPLRALGILCVLAFALERITRALGASQF